MQQNSYVKAAIRKHYQSVQDVVTEEKHIHLPWMQNLFVGYVHLKKIDNALNVTNHFRQDMAECAKIVMLKILLHVKQILLQALCLLTCQKYL
jgi:hypothetical protein